MSQNMKRFRRGEISRVNPKKGVHTDVHFGATAQAGSTPATGENQDARVKKLTDRVAALEAENAELKKAKGTLDDQHEDAYVELKAKLDTVTTENAKLVTDREELERQLSEQEAPKSVSGLRVLKVLEVSETDDLMRVDCELKPTDGPLASTGAIILPISEVWKLAGEDNVEKDVNEEEDAEG